MNLLLIPQSRARGKRRVQIHSGEGAMIPVEFFEGANGMMDLYMERWRLYRKGK